MNNIKDFIIKELLIVIIMGCVYTNIEMIFRGYTHPSMIIVGGLCGMLAGLINDITPEMKMYKQCILSAIIITIIEYISGYILNKRTNFAYIQFGMGIFKLFCDKIRRYA